PGRARRPARAARRSRLARGRLRRARPEHDVPAPHRGRGRARDAVEPRRARSLLHARARERPERGPRGDLGAAVTDARVTVIVAAYNGERFLRETLESV